MRSDRTRPAGRSWPLALALVALGGCVSFSPDGGFYAVQETVRERVQKDVVWQRTETDSLRAREWVSSLLAQPLTADTAVQIALLNNRGLQATFSELGIAEADLVQAGRLRNPGFSYARLTKGDHVEIERAFFLDVLGLVTMPLRTELERRRFELTKVRVAAQVLQVGADARRAYFRTVAAQEGEKYAAQVREAAEASAELARRMAAAGNFSKLDYAREQLFYAEATALQARARQRAISEREALNRTLGLWGSDLGYRLPDRLPDLPARTREIEALEATALRQRLDVSAAMQEARNIAGSLGLTRTTGFLNVLELGYLHNNESGDPRQTGYEIELALPIFDWGGAKVARAQHTYMQAVNRAADLAVRARSEVREAYSAYRSAFDVARHFRDEIVPLRKRISEENVLRYNGMLISVFELLVDARQQVGAVNAYIEALRDFWIAEADLSLALTGRSPGPMNMPASSAPAPAAAGGH